MDIKQILIFGLFLVPVCTSKRSPCYEEHRLREEAEKKLKSHYPQPPDPSTNSTRDSPVSCPVESFYQKPSEDANERSLSPWRYVRVIQTDRFPSEYSEAQCLCSGCILIQDKKPPMEIHDYDSKLIKQSRVFLKKELCEDGKKYYLKPVSEEVGVGCTCTRASTSS
ncbi:interleukin-17C [Plectropomus leopardus]|uniref:interleukin-17C n=1 Tax=Plectropomus leopardus TaxID=160734 RepID=UPI001C4BAFFB|nr:interleukin-17C [Plectropomus leopardus]